MKCITCGKEECNKHKKKCSDCSRFKVFSPNELRKKSNPIYIHRVDNYYCDRIALSALFQPEGGFKSKREYIKAKVLMMNPGWDMYNKLPDNEKEKIGLLIENEKIVNMVIESLYLWFGSRCGLNEIEELARLIRRMEPMHNKLNKNGI